jgi:predicted RNA-binding protein Jag
MERERYSQHPRVSRGKIDHLLEKLKHDLENSLEPVSIFKLNAFERKLIHRQFDHDPNFVTKTYRNGEDFELKVYPVGNLKKFAEQKAQEAITSGQKVVLPHMSNYARYVIHDTLKALETVKSASYGEGEERHIEIEPEVYGRGLRKIIKKIRLF